MVFCCWANDRPLLVLFGSSPPPPLTHSHQLILEFKWQKGSQTKQIHWIYIPQWSVILETHKSQNINPFSPTPKFNMGIIQIIIKSLSTIFSALFNKNILICTISISDPSIRPRGQGCVYFQSFCFYVGLCFFPFNLKCKWPCSRKNSFDLLTWFEGVCKDKICACMVLFPPLPLIWYATWLLSEAKNVLTFRPHRRHQGCV